ncbi:MAG: response regulator, partial [Candidatus Sumerlaeia bacterium]|nr:response regulator [Candidatus Sumerlaeia bacterium]
MSDIKNILVVDDQPTVCESVKKILSRRGYVVQEAFSAEEAIEKMDKEPQTFSPRLVIADLMMPKVDGLELTKIIKERYPETGVVIITGYAGINSAVKAAKLGALEYLAKPFTPEELVEVTERAFNKLMEKFKKQTTAQPVTKTEVKTSVSQKLDVDLPFDANELQQQTSALYVETVTSSDIPVAGTRISES